tara:strand:+ start:3292 stop:3852 length:561 start_codon:yes stop_codon:yes gene_type:complete
MVISQKMFHQFNKMIIKKNWSKIQEAPLKRAGLLTRTIMRGSIRRVKPFTKTGKPTKPSKPGKPPKSRDPRHPFKQIFSVPFPKQGQVIIGHQGFGQRQTPMETHEFGKSVTAKVFPKKKRGRKRISARQKAAARKKYLSGKIKHKPVPTKTIKMPKRPFARPAMIKAKPRIVKFWKGSFNSRVVN